MMGLMPEFIEIDQIILRSEQGVTKPFLCRGSDDYDYFVKGRSAGRRSLICEWVAGHLAISFGLPVPEFRILQAPRDLIEMFPEGSDLGSGLVFGSRVIPDVVEFSPSEIASVPSELQRDIFCFDMWVQNGDRTLSALGGNPNLLRDLRDDRLVVVDHNLAFEDNFDLAQSSRSHAFGSQLNTIVGDWVEAERLRSLISHSTPVVRRAFASMPEEWHHEDDELTVPAPISETQILQILNRWNDKDLFS